jgi:DNA-binding XRE family transcriptional regulator
MKLTLKACRVNINASVKEVAKAVGVTEDTVYNWESGKYSPRAKQIIKLLDFFASRGLPISLYDINFLP